MKRLLSLFIMFFLVFPAYSQIDETEDLVDPNSRIGVRGGLNYSKIDADLGGNTTALRSIHIGIFYQKFFTPSFSFQPEIQYSVEGWENDGVEYRVTYLALPLVGKYYMIRGFNLMGGIQPALQLSTEYDNTTNSIDIDDKISRTNLSVLFGVGYDFDFGLRFGGRYMQGLLDVNDGLQVGTKDNEIKTRSIQVFIGYSFPLPKSGRPGYGPQ